MGLMESMGLVQGSDVAFIILLHQLTSEFVNCKLSPVYMITTGGSELTLNLNQSTLVEGKGITVLLELFNQPK